MNKFADKLKKSRSYDTHKDIQKNPGGRPKKNPEHKATEKVFVNLTKEEKQRLEETVAALGIGSLSGAVKMLLKEKGWI